MNIFNLAKNAGTSVEQLERFYLKNLEMNDDLVENLQTFSREVQIKLCQLNGVGCFDISLWILSWFID